jgi:DNA-binding NarL/FixJ family response regulator
VLFTDIARSTETAARLGDRRWGELLARHDEMVRDALRTSGGHEVHTTGDGMLALFESPGEAVACAVKVTQQAPELGMQIRAGLHTGECDVTTESVSGLAVHVAARVVALAEPGEVLVSTTVRDLASGGDFGFTPRGTHTLKGVPRRWRVFAVGPRPSVEAQDTPRRPPAKKAVRRSRRSTTPLRVVIADDHPLWRQTLKAVVEQGRFATVVAEAATGVQAVEAGGATAPDVVVMDIEMPGLDGIEATARLVAEGVAQKVLMLSSSDERAHVARALRAGASGYMLKTSGSDEIRDAIRRIAAGELVFPPDVAALVLDQLRGRSGEAPASPPTPLAQLTSRERDILDLMATGCSNSAIAERLHLSPKTVEAHSSAIFSKLGVDASAAAHRRVLAVVTYLDATRREGGVGASP